MTMTGVGLTVSNTSLVRSFPLTPFEEPQSLLSAELYEAGMLPPPEPSLPPALSPLSGNQNAKTATEEV